MRSINDYYILAEAKLLELKECYEELDHELQAKLRKKIKGKFDLI